MARKRVAIPPSNPDHPPATDDQVQYVRRLCSHTGVKIGVDPGDLTKWQIAEVIDQLKEIQAENGSAKPAPAKSGGCGCGALTLISVLIALLVGIGWFVIKGAGSSNQPQTKEVPQTAEDNSGGGDTSAVPELFPENDTDPPTPAPGESQPEIERQPERQPQPLPPSEIDLAAQAKQLREIEQVLVAVSQASREPVAASIRERAGGAMLERLDAASKYENWNAIDYGELRLIIGDSHALIQAWIDGKQDGQQMRDSVDALRERINSLK